MRPGADPSQSLFAGPGEMRALCRATDWGATPLGPVSRWPESLRLAVRLCLDALFPMSVWAGEELVLLYNFGYPPILGADRHPWALGRPAREVWASVWPQIEGDLASVMGGVSTCHEDVRFVLEIDGREEERFFTYSFTPIQEADARVVGALNVFMDTTARVRALGEREARYRALFEAADDAILVTDADSGRVVEANAAARRLFGYTDAEFRARDRGAMLDPSDPALAALLHDREEHGVAGATLTYLRKDGSRFPGELRTAFFPGSDERRLAVAIIRDATERRRAEQVVRDSEAKLRLLVENVSSGVALIDGGGRFTLVNGRFLELFGLEPDADIHNINSRDWGAWRVYDETGSVLDVDDHPVRKAVRLLRPVRNQLVGVQSPGSSKVVWMLVGAAPLLAPDGTLEHVICTYHDTTELREAQERLVEADERKNQFMAALSHELRNPLAPIRNGLQILRRVAPGGEQARRAQEIMERQVDQLARLVDDLLDVTRIARGKIQLQRRAVEVRDLVRRTLEDNGSLFEAARVAVTLREGPEPLVVNADEHRVAQVVGNLLQNAAKFTPAGGRVTVSVERDPAVRQAVVRVSDTGSGMTPEMLGRLFEPFSQADQTLARSKGGLGLGLALVKRLVELHGGSVAAASAGPGEGSEFTVRLPLEETGPGEAARAGSAPGRAPRRVLIIEDNADAAESLHDLLELEGHETAVARDGPEGLAKARAFRPEVVLCDIGLPGMSGYDVARAFRADDALQRVRLVALTGYGLPEDVERAAAAGFDRHLVKPATVATLADVLSR